jgi:predicted metalloprotease
MLALVTVAQVPAAAQQTPTPAAQGYRGASQAQAYQGAFSDLANEIDFYWAETFLAEGSPYESPNIFVIERVTQTACGLIAPQPNALYCPYDRTIYLIPEFLEDQRDRFGDFAPIAVLSHEWGHHVQALSNVIGLGASTKTIELQADCLMGAFIRHADEEGLLDYGDFLEAINSALDAGEDPLPQDAEGTHGQPEERVKELSKGYGGGPIAGCEMTFVVGGDGEVFLPDLPPLAHAACFRREAEGDLRLEELIQRFTSPDEARERLRGWGWRTSAYRTFACDGPPEDEAGWLDISAHLFGTPTAAQEAADYFADVRAEGTWLTRGPQPSVGDYAVSLAGPAVNGNEVTIYASQGPILVRVTGVAPSGIPFENVLTVTEAVLDLQLAAPQSETVETNFVPSSAYLPSAPDVNYAECFSPLTDGAYSYNDVVAALLPTGLTQSQFDGLGWRDGAYRVFTCPDPPAGRATQIDVVIHQFQDAPSAQMALPYFSSTYEAGENESRSCDDAGPLVVCVTGRSLSGSPLSDVHFVLQQVVGGVGQ